MKPSILVGLLTAGFHLPSVSGAVIAVANASFEADIVPMDGNPATVGSGDDHLYYFTPTGWSLGSTDSNACGQISMRTSSYFDSRLADTPDSVDNEQAFFSDGWDIFQVLGANLAANSTYTLVVDVGDRSDFSPAAFYAGIRFGTGAAFGLNLFTPVASLTPSAPDGGWAQWQLTFQTGSSPAGLGQPLRIELLGDVVGTQGIYDNVRLSVVPESSSLMLGGVGLIMLWRRRR